MSQVEPHNRTLNQESATTFQKKIVRAKAMALTNQAPGSLSGSQFTHSNYDAYFEQINRPKIFLRNLEKDGIH